MDLICSFVREEKDDRRMFSHSSTLHHKLTGIVLAVMTTTLCALHLCSRQWTSSALRALHFDRTRCLSSTHSAKGAWLLLRKYVAIPPTGFHVQSLRHLPRVLDRFETCDELEEIQVSAWLMSMLRLCPNIRTLGASAQDGMAWSSALHSFPRLRHLAVDTKDGIIGNENVLPFLTSLFLPPGLETLVVSDFELDYAEASTQIGNIGLVKHLELRDFRIYSCHGQTFPLASVHLESLLLEPDIMHAQDLHPLLPPTLVSLLFQPLAPRQSPPNSYTEGLEAEYDVGVKQGPFPFTRMPLLPNLRHLTFEYVDLRLAHFSGLLRSCPRVEHVSFKDSTWDIVESSSGTDFDLGLATIIASVPSLSFVDLGWVPILAKTELPRTTAYCLTAGIELVIVPSLRQRHLEEYLDETDPEE